jgi:hypothetical protein
MPKFTLLCEASFCTRRLGIEVDDAPRSVNDVLPPVGQRMRRLCWPLQSCRRQTGVCCNAGKHTKP